MHAVSGDVPVARSVLPEGEAGVDATVRKMMQLAHSKWGSKSPKIRALTMNIVNRAGVSEKDYYGEICAVHDWLKNPANVRYFRDPVGQETLADPEQTAFNLQGGDCDDKTTLEIAMLGSIGIVSYPVVIGLQPHQFSHVYLYAEVPVGNHRNSGKIVPLDPIMKDWPAGKEAPGDKIKAKKVYKNLSNPLTINGVSMGHLGDLGSYVTGPSYLDTEDSHAQELLMPDKKSSYIYPDKTVANSVRATVPVEGMDAMMGNRMEEIRPTGGTYTATSAGDGGTILKQDGELIPRGFIRDEPSRTELMAMTPASAKRLGPLGPIIAQSYASSPKVGNLPRSKPQRISSLQNEMAHNIRPTPVPTVIGRKRYDIPSIQQQTTSKNLTGKEYRANFAKTQKVVTLKARQPVNLGLNAKPRTLGEACALAEGCMGMLGAEIGKRQAVLGKLPAAQREQVTNEIKALRAKLVTAEQTVLALRQEIRDRQQKGQAAAGKPGVRAAAIAQQQAQVQYPGHVTKSADHEPMYGVGEFSASGFVDALKSPVVYVPAFAVAVFFLFRRFARK